MLNITKEQALFELLISINIGEFTYDNFGYAKRQLNQLESYGMVFKEDVEED